MGFIYLMTFNDYLIFAAITLIINRYQPKLPEIPEPNKGFGYFR